MAQVELARAAVADLDRLVRTHSLPGDIGERVRTSLQPLGRFPRLGHELTDRWEGFRFILGPWRLMRLIYVFDASRDQRVNDGVGRVRPVRPTGADGSRNGYPQASRSTPLDDVHLLHIRA